MSAARARLPRSAAFRTFEIGDQKLLLVRDDGGVLQAFTTPAGIAAPRCAARARACCARARSICPYHAWVYNLQGELLRTSSKAHPRGFDVADFPLYKISVREWSGFIFVALTDDPPPFERMLRSAADRLDAWPLERSRGRPRAHEDHAVQLEDLLGELQRVPALPGRASEALAISCRSTAADCWRSATIPNGAGACGGGRPEVQGRTARGRRHLVDRRRSSTGVAFPGLVARRIARRATST